MIYISHRGNITGPNPERENSPEYIDEALSQGYEVEIDLWVSNNKIFLGHDFPKYQIDLNWLLCRYLKLWIHCKNVEAIVYMQKQNHLHYFWHNTDLLTLTSLNYVWVYPKEQPIANSIAVLPEINDDDISQAIGICSDYVQEYKLNNK